jgi:hypothetical protein
MSFHMSPTFLPNTHAQQSTYQSFQQYNTFITHDDAGTSHTKHPSPGRFFESAAAFQAEQHPRDLFNIPNHHSDSIDPHLLEVPFMQFNLDGRALPQNQLHGTEPERPIVPVNPEPQTEKPPRSPKDYSLLSTGYLAKKNKDGNLDCFEDCELRRYGKRGFTRRSNLLTHLRSCHLQDIPRNDKIKTRNKGQRPRRLGRGCSKSIKRHKIRNIRDI